MNKNKIGKIVLLTGSLLSPNLVKADLISPGEAFIRQFREPSFLIGIGIIILFIGLIAWFIIRRIKKKNTKDKKEEKRKTK